MINALKGRTDEYSMKCKAGLECDPHALRIRKTKLKPLDDQHSILEAFVEKRTTMEAQQQLLQVREQKAAEDAKASAQKAEQ